MTTNYKALIRSQEENSSGNIVDEDSIRDLIEAFHPLQDQNNKVPPTGILVHGTDVADMFEPLSSGKRCDLPTGYHYNGTDLRDIFCGKDRISSGLTLGVLPAGTFTCDTNFKIYLDTSGSMNVALSYVRPAANTLYNFFQNVVYGTGSNYMHSTTSYTNEYCVTWLSYSLDSRNSTAAPPREISMAFINESDSRGLGSSQAYVDRWNTVNNLGGVKYSAIGGVEIPGHKFASQVKQRLEGTSGGYALKNYGMQGFFDITNSTTSAQYVSMIVDWLNIPTTPNQLNPQTIAAGASVDSVTWNFNDYICGRTHQPSDNSTGYTRTQLNWVIEVSTEGSSDTIVHTETHNTRPVTFTYIPTKVSPLYDAYVDEYGDLADAYETTSAGRTKAQWGEDHWKAYGVRENRVVPTTSVQGNKFYCRLVAAAEPGYSSAVSDWVLNEILNTPPEIHMIGDQVIHHNYNTPFVDPSAYAFDVDDGFLTITRTGEIGSTPGEYQLTYTATDSTGATVSVNRSVILTNTPPELIMMGDQDVVV